MQASAVVWGKYYKNDLYFTQDNVLYKYTSKMASQGTKPTIIKKNVTDYTFFDNRLIYVTNDGMYVLKMTDLKAKPLKLAKYIWGILGFDNGYVYYRKSSGWFRVKLNGKGKEKLLGGDKYEVALKDGLLYYSTYLGDKEIMGAKLKSIDPDTKEKRSYIRTSNKKRYSFFEVEGELFTSNGKDLYKLNSSTGQFYKLGNENDLDINCSGKGDGCFYSIDKTYIEDIEAGTEDYIVKVYEINTDGDQKILHSFSYSTDRINDEGAYRFTQNGNYNILTNYDDSSTTIYLYDNDFNSILKRDDREARGDETYISLGIKDDKAYFIVSGEYDKEIPEIVDLK
ncbi:MAG: DUF5050 domain-containing protein [Lachnospiraceae bacterium]|nr:DUF5050 domain-containing protein [Lachnospiraceae bacterium]